MRLNTWEFLAMNNPLRKILLKEVELRQFYKLIQHLKLPIHESKILDVACGSGYSSYLITKFFSPGTLISFDFMPEQIKLARKLNYSKNLFLGDVESLSIKAATFDWIFGFGFLHHLTNWRQAVAELSRVLKPDGFMILEEPNGKASDFFRKYIRFAIPKEGQFTFRELIAEFKLNKVVILKEKKILLNCFRSFIFQKVL